MSLSIKPIKEKIKGKCALCGKDYESGSGYALFMPDTENPVCDSCAIKEDPKLLIILKLVRD